MRAIPVALLSLLLLPASASASTLAFQDGTYAWTGTESDETLDVLPGAAEGGLVFVDRDGEITSHPSLGGHCTAISAAEVRCTTPAEAVVIEGGRGSDRLGTPDRRVSSLKVPLTLDGGDHGDHLRGGRGDDTLIGGPAEDTLIGGLGGDTIDGGDDLDTVLHDFDGRRKGVSVELFAKQEGPDPGDGYQDVENVFGTRYDDSIDIENVQGQVATGAGDDFVDISGSGKSDAECGGGDDVVSTSPSDRIFGCEHVGETPDPDDWVSGHFFVSAARAIFFDEELDFVGYAVCAANQGERCRLKTSFTFEKSGFTLASDVVVKRGKFGDPTVTLSAAQRARLRSDGPQRARFESRLKSPGLPAVRVRLRIRVPAPD